MAKLRERNDQVEVILERRHVILLGLCALVLGSLLFLLGMLTQRNWLGAPAKMVAETRKDTPPPLFANRSAEPNVQGKDFEFYESLAGSQAKEPKKPREQRASRKTNDTTRSSVPVVPAVATSTESGDTNPDASRRAAQLEPAGSAAKKQVDLPVPSVQPERVEPKPAAKTSVAKVADRQSSKSEPVAKTAAKGSNTALKADKSGNFVLQVIALSDKSSANDYLKRLKSKGYPAFVDQTRLNGKVLYRVKVGNYGTMDKAKKIADKLEGEVGKRILVQRTA